MKEREYGPESIPMDDWDARQAKEQAERIAALTPEQKVKRQEALDYLESLRKIGARVDEFGRITERVERARISATIDTERLRADLDQARSPAERDLWERIIKLPETLDFKEGTNLIVGYNGMGKTTLARALFVSALASHNETEIQAEAAGKMARGNVDEDNYDIFKNPQKNALLRALMARTGLGGSAHIGKNLGLSDPLYTYLQATMISSRDEDPGRGPHTFLDIPTLKGVLEEQHKYTFQDSMTPFDVGSGSGVRQVTMRRQRDVQKEIEAERARQGSTRQAVDGIIPELLGDYIGPRVMFMDEPETGMDPWRQQDFEKWYQKLVDADDYEPGRPKSTSIITTNSPGLVFNTDLPRIDLRMPERGVFRPSDVEGYFDIR